MIAKMFQRTLLVGLMLAAGCRNERQAGSAIFGTYTVTVDYDVKLSRLVTAAAYPGFRNPYITEANFPAERSGTAKVTVQLVHLDRWASTQEVKDKLTRRGLRPATLRELLAVGAQDRELGDAFPVVALGSAWTGPGGSPGVPYVGWDADGRRLDLSWADGHWSGDRFAVVRE